MANGAELRDLAGLAAHPTANPDVVKLFEAVLAEARRGGITTVAMILVSRPGEMQVAGAGGATMEIVCGCEVLKGNMLAQMMGRPSSVIRPV